MANVCILSKNTQPFVIKRFLAPKYKSEIFPSHYNDF